MNTYTYFQDLILDINKKVFPNVRVVNHAGGKHVGIAFVDQNFPISINEAEYNFMQDLIIRHNLKNGFELSTGVGISTLGIGLGLQKTNGHLTTLDSYYEDLNQVSQNIPVMAYTPETIELIKNKSISYNFVKKLLSAYSLNDNVSQLIGWSPIDSIEIAKKSTPFDFIFLDCPKDDKEFERDIVSLRPFIADKYVICVHDTHCYTRKSYDLVKSLFKKNMNQIHAYFKDTPHYSIRHFPLGIITNLEI